jgi:hypothetical protein
VNSSTLRALLAKTLQNEKKHKAQGFLEQLRDAASNMASAPQEPSYQSQFAEVLGSLKSSVTGIAASLSPADIERLDEISSRYEFSIALVKDVEAAIAENPATPAVIRDKLTEFAVERADTLSHLNNLFQELVYFGFDDEFNSADQGQVGFKVPRPLFENSLSGFIAELNFVRKFVRLTSEAEGENPDAIEIGTISTSDPLVWVIVAYGVARTIGSVTDWALDTWKKVEEIRNIRAQTKNLTAFKPEEVEEIFGPKIETQIQEAIEAKVAELVANIKNQARRNELENGFRFALRQFLARIERGMTVDVRYLPAPLGGDASEEQEESVEQKTAGMNAVASTLVFPRPIGDPVLKIEAANDDRPRGRPPKA